MPTIIKNVTFNEKNMCLLADEVTTTYINRQIFEQFNKQLQFPLREIGVDQIFPLRQTKTPYFILKLNDKFYFAKIRRNLRLTGCNITGKHLCSQDRSLCKRLSAASDEEGGCARIRQSCWGIERYNFITSGYETFNTNHDVFIVTGCTHHSPSAAHKVDEPLEADDSFAVFSQFMFK